MNKIPLESLNDEIVPLDHVIIPFLKGAGLNLNSIFLNALVEQTQEDAFDIFIRQSNKNDIDTILDNLVSDTKSKKQLKTDYESWIKDLHVSHNLIHFLEFLSTKNFHRARNLLKEIHQHQFKNSYVFPFLSGLLALVAGAGCYFYLNPEKWDVFVKLVLEKLPEYSKNLLTIAMSAEILSGLIILFQLGRFFYENYRILSNKTTKTQIKFAKLSKINAQYVLSIAAQVLIFFNSGTTTTISSILFFFAAVISFALTYLEFYHHQEPSKLNQDVSSKKELLLNQVHYEEQLSYYERKQMQLNTEFFALIPITIISITSIFLSPYYVFLTPIFACCQFLIATLKTLYIQNQNKNFANQLQTTIRAEFEKEKRDVKAILGDQNLTPAEQINLISSIFNMPRRPEPVESPSLMKA